MTTDLCDRIRQVVGSLAEEQQAVAVGLITLLKRLDPPHLDGAASTVSRDKNGLHITFIHRTHQDLRVDVYATGAGEVVVSYGHEHEHFRSEDAEVGRVWPFSSADLIEAVLTLVEGLLTGRVDLHVWKRPLAVKTHSYWINDDGRPELFLRGATAGPFLGFSRRPEIYRFDYMGTIGGEQTGES